MSFDVKWAVRASREFAALRDQAKAALANRKQSPGKKKTKASKIEGLFKQVDKAIKLLCENPRHPGLNTHKFDSLMHPYDAKKDVFEAYAQNQTPGAYRVFWCYGPNKGEITIIAITPHP